MLLGHSQEDLARKSGLAPKTIYRLERGLSVSRRSLLKACDALDVVPAQLQVPYPPTAAPCGYSVHRNGSHVWFTFGMDKRGKTTVDDFERIQTPEERLRLGRLGLVTAFGSALEFIMPEGPGILVMEVYGRIEGNVNGTLYRECVYACGQGRLRIGVLDEVVELGKGDALGCRSADVRWIEPAAPIGHQGSPTMLTWTGAVRVGNAPREVGPGERVKRRRKGGGGG